MYSSVRAIVGNESNEQAEVLQDHSDSSPNKEPVMQVYGSHDQLLFDETGGDGTEDQFIDFHISELPRSLQDNGTIIGTGSRDQTQNNTVSGEHSNAPY